MKGSESWSMESCMVGRWDTLDPEVPACDVLGLIFRKDYYTNWYWSKECGFLWSSFSLFGLIQPYFCLVFSSSSAITAEDSFYVLRFDRDAYSAKVEEGTEIRHTRWAIIYRTTYCNGNSGQLYCMRNQSSLPCLLNEPKLTDYRNASKADMYLEIIINSDHITLWISALSLSMSNGRSSGRPHLRFSVMQVVSFNYSRTC